jgi:hypothetical protein
VADAPDVVLEPALDRGYAYTFLSSGGRPGEAFRTLGPAERLGAKGGSMNGSHRPDGLCLLAGAGIRCGGRLVGARIVDVVPTLLCLLGEPLPGGLDGRVLAEALLPGARVPPGTAAAASAGTPRPYSPDQAAVVAGRLRGLGYRG